MSSEELKPCPFCGGDVSFHKDEGCDGCHFIQCGQCRAFFDFATGADPGNDCASVDALRAAIAPMWNRRALSVQQSATVAIEPKPLDVIGYASPGQVEILRSLPRTGGMKVKGRKDDRYSEPVVLLKDARAALISLAARCQQEGAFKVCLECGYQDGHDEICQFHATNRKQGQSSHVSVSRELLEKVCDPKSSTNRQEGRKSIRTLLKEREPAGQYNHKRIGWELERTAMGDGYYGNALRVAKDIPGLTDQDRAVLDRYATGAQHGTDHIALQDIAMRVYAAQGEGEDQ